MVNIIYLYRMELWKIYNINYISGYLKGKKTFKNDFIIVFVKTRAKIIICNFLCGLVGIHFFMNVILVLCS